MALIGALNIGLFVNSARFNSGLQSASKSVRGFVGTINSINPALSALGIGLGVAGIVLAMKRVITTGAQFQHQMQAVKAISGATGKEFEALSKEAQRLGAQTQFTAKEAGAAMEVLAQAGLSTNTILTAIGPTLNLAAAGGIEIAQAADVAVTSMTGMGIAADKLQQTVDVLAKAASSSNADLLGIGEALNTAGPIAKAAGKDINETVSAIEALSNAGIKGEEAGTSLRQIMLKLADKTPEAQKALRQLGISTTDVAGNIRPLADIIDDFNKKLAGLGSGKKLEQLSHIFEARAATGFAALLGQGGDALRNFQKDLEGATGEAARQAETRMDSLAGDWEKFTSAVDGLSITITKGTNSWLRSIVQFATKSVDFINSIVPQWFNTISAEMQAIAQMFRAAWNTVATITQTVFGGSLTLAKTTMQDVAEIIIGSLAAIEFGFTHWQEVAALAGLKVVASVVTMGNQVVYVFREVIPATLTWMANNWYSIFNTIVDFTATVFINLGKNIRQSIGQIFAAIKSGDASKIDLGAVWGKSLTEGFHNSISELPKIAEREAGPLEAALGAEIAALEAKVGVGFSEFLQKRIQEFRDREAAAQKPGSSFEDFLKNTADKKAPAGIADNIERPKALERGTAEAFSASFGKGNPPALQEAKKQTKIQQKQAAETQRIRILQERNQVQGLGFA